MECQGGAEGLGCVGCAVAGLEGAGGVGGAVGVIECVGGVGGVEGDGGRVGGEHMQVHRLHHLGGKLRDCFRTE